MTLGGYDAARAAPESVPILFAPSETRYLSVGVQSITFTNSSTNAEPLLSDDEGIYALIDSTIPDLWLPNDTCTRFAEAFGLTFNSLRLKYTIDSEQHERNIEENPSVSFKVGNLNQGGTSVDITFPYAAFDLNYTVPSSKDSRSFAYFPLRQANQASQFTLGRAFLQETYLTVDYERKNFSLAQALPATEDAATRIVPIVSPADVASTSNTPSSTDVPPGLTAVSNSSSFPTGAIAGIVIPLVLIVAAALFYWRKRRNSKKKQHYDSEKQPGAPPDAHPDASELPNETLPPSYTESQPHAKNGPVVTTSELETPPLETRTFAFGQPLNASPAELAGKQTGHELHSRSVSTDSSIPRWGGNEQESAPGMDSRISNFHAEESPLVEPFSGGTYFGPGSPDTVQSAERMQVKVTTKEARMINVPPSTVSSPGTRRDFSRTSLTSDEAFLTSCGSGRTSPDVGRCDSPETFKSLSAFQSPQFPHPETFSPVPEPYDLK